MTEPLRPITPVLPVSVPTGQTQAAVGALAAVTLIYGASYTLWMYKRTIFGAITNPAVQEMKDINAREFAVLAILAMAVIGMGVWPEPLIAVVHQAANDLIAQVAQSKI